MKIWCICLCVLGLTSCNKKILIEIKNLNQRLNRLDSIYTSTNNQVFQYEKSRIEQAYRDISDAELRNRIQSIITKNPYRP